jgi:hypothetical protein
MAKIIYFLADGAMRWWRLPRYANRAERQFRMQRGFPTVDQRVRLYMAHWYLPPCPDTVRLSFSIARVPHRLKNITTWWSDSTLRSVTNDIDYIVTAPGLPVVPAGGGGHQPPQRPQNLTISSRARPDEVFYLDNDELYYCYRQRDWSIRFYCRDAQLSMGGGRENKNFPPIFLEFTDHNNTVVVVHRGNDDGSDSGGGRETIGLENNNKNNKVDNPNIPVIKKLRLALPKSEVEDILNDTYNHSSRCQDLAIHTPLTSHPYRQPILWLLNTNRHFKYSWDIPRYDIPWHDKKDSAIFRGELTGLQYDPTVTPEENCDRLPRCRLVVQNAGHHRADLRVDALLTNTFGKIPDVLHGVNVTGPKLRRADFLQHKGLIVLEGNDVSSGLKWSMVSNSVVLMPPPTFTSWAMEELLEPWQHYIPLRPDLSDVDQKVQWMLANQAESQRIAHRAKLWILDLYFHPDAMKEAKLINEEILRRYRLLFEENVVAGP